MDAPKDLDLMHKRVVFSILQYLTGLTQAGDAAPAGLDKEGLEVAVQCISSAFGVDPASAEHQAQYAVPFQLTDIYNFGLLHLAQQQQQQQQQQAPPAELAKPSGGGQEVPKELEAKFQAFLSVLEGKNFFAGLAKGTNEYQERYNLAKQRFLSQYSPAVDPQQEAEKFKALGNEKLSAGQPAEAIELYNKAISFNPNNAVYYGNRAAAHSTLQHHESAITDCKRAIELDPKYLKAYSRLGFSLFSLGKYSEAMEQGYQKVLAIDPDNAAAQESVRLCRQKLEQSAAPQQQASSPLGGAGGMPGLAQMMNNPEMQNSMRQMFGGAGGAGGGAPPDLGGLLGNPDLMNMAQQMMSSPQFSQILNNPMFMNMAQNLMQNPSQLSQMFSQLGGEGGQGGSTEDDDKPQQP